MVSSQVENCALARQPWTWPLLPTPADSRVAAQHRQTSHCRLDQSTKKRKQKPKSQPKHYTLLSKYMFNSDAKSLTRSDVYSMGLTLVV